jgi:hypothetical protein
MSSSAATAADGWALHISVFQGPPASQAELRETANVKDVLTIVFPIKFSLLEHLHG